MPPFSYTLEDQLARATDRHRVFYTFWPVAHGGPAPLLVAYNGGPGASSATLLASGLIHERLDFNALGTPTLVDNPHPWTAFASVLVIDAPDSGFSHRYVERPEDQVAFDPDADASIVLRAVLGILSRHPDYLPERLGFVGESYGGVRTTLILDRFFERAEMQEPETDGYRDATLGADLDAYLGRIFSDVAEVNDAILGDHLLQIHIQTVVLGQVQSECSTASFLGSLMAPPGCPELPVPDGCSPMPGSYFCDLSEDVERTMLTLPDAAIVSPPAFEALTGVSMTDVPGFSPAERYGAVRPQEALEVDTSAMEAVLGPLSPPDAYYRALSVFAGESGVRSRMGDQVGPPPDFPIVRPLSETFLEHVRHVPAFFTNAGHDLVVRQDVLAPLLDAMEGVSARLDESPRPGVVRPGWLEVCADRGPTPCRELRFVRYPTSGHTVTVRNHEELAADLAEWLELL